MNETQSLLPLDAEPAKKKSPAREYKLVALRECPVPGDDLACERADQAAAYWRANVTTHPLFNPEVECIVILLLNARSRIKGHVLITTGIVNSCLAHAREVFRPAIVGGACSIVMMHNHPSGDPTPSDPDVRMTRDMIRAGQLLKINLLDHVIVGADKHSSLRELGFFYTDSESR